ncbi:MAG TPA: crosslink repair DNA glycosylase YcaQ family protein, partial [Anaerolineae bacterium]|nr:crosslink repair DNA glycosylase YcaQ family protein [Anaerolineae bacterium]
LVSDWMGAGEALDREEALARLAARYVASHGPATRHDFAWWAGLRLAEARQALDAAPDVAALDAGGVEYWAIGDPPPPAAAESACLLPRFDEYLLGYKERAAVLDPVHAKRVNAGGGMPKPTVMVDGEIVGTWGYEEKRDVLAVSVEAFRALTAGQREQMERGAGRLAEYAGVPVDLQF